jgi:ectoine hydroxylase-related dioxygenase (phytanoyl-CoA dioxygenase family)
MTDIDFYQSNGYLIFNPNIPSNLIDDIIKTVDINNGRNQDEWTKNKYVKELAIFPNIIAKIQELYNKAPLPFQTLNFNVGTSQRVHSDTVHFNSYPKGNMCGVWVALEDITSENGPLFFYPKTHLEPELTYKDFDISQDGLEAYHLYEIRLQELIDNKGYIKKEAIMKRGEAIIWASNLLHGGSPVTNKDTTRYSQVTHYFFESEYYYTPLLSKQEIFLRNPVWITK